MSLELKLGIVAFWVRVWILVRALDSIVFRLLTPSIFWVRVNCRDNRGRRWVNLVGVVDLFLVDLLLEEEGRLRGS